MLKVTAIIHSVDINSADKKTYLVLLVVLSVLLIVQVLSGAGFTFTGVHTTNRVEVDEKK